MGLAAILQPRCHVILDTCALIYLVRLNLLERAAAGFDLLIPEQVLAEFRHKSGGRPVSEVVERLLREERLTLRPSTGQGTQPLSGGEGACLALARQLTGDRANPPAVVVTDDGKACRVLRAQGIPFLNTPLLICTLVRLGRLTAADAAAAIRRNLAMGRYGQDVIRRIRLHFHESTGEILETGP